MAALDAAMTKQTARAAGLAVPEAGDLLRHQAVTGARQLGLLEG